MKIFWNIAGIIYCTLLLLFIAIAVQAQEQDAVPLTQTIRGKIIDQDAQTPAIGANVIVLKSDPILGASTDINGEFRIENVPVGRVNLQVTYLGYEDKILPNVLVGTGKEVVLTVEIVESVVKMDEIEVTATRNKAEVLNEMATVSARSFSVEETKRYAGSISDPARMVSAYAGVVTEASGNNDIVVRGNSPRGILWRLEGIEIPNPNHFSDEGATGGPINALNASVLSNSDFFTGAFPAEYGNAYSGIFDIRLRNGNNEKREYSLGAGVIGTDFTMEGPFKSGGKSSYLVNYRYSSLAILDNAGVVDFNGVPKYQDAAFKLIFPTEKFGVFSMFGLGGKSGILQEYENETDASIIQANSTFSSDFGVMGLNHSLLLGSNSYLKSFASVAASRTGFEFNWRDDDTNEMYLDDNDDFIKIHSRFGTTFNHKFNAQHTVKAGAILTLMQYDLSSNYFDEETDTRITSIEADGQSAMMQGFVAWKYRIGEKVTINSGVHYLQLALNNNYSIEPRVGMKWQFLPNQSLTAGFGVHSKVESLSNYLATKTEADGTVTQPNKNMGLAKANHYVIGYDNMLTRNLYFKTEVYYQQLYDVLVENDVNSTYALMNQNEWFTTREMVNEGSGSNYGLEFTLERYFARRFYCLMTASVYESKYKALDGVERDTKYNGNYAGNLLIGKEFPVGDPNKSKTIALNLKTALIGGKRYTPIDLEKSVAAGYTVRDNSQPYSVKAEDIFKPDISIAYRRNRKKTTGELKLEVLNFTNNQAVLNEWYNGRTHAIEKQTQLAILPNISYKLDF